MNKNNTEAGISSIYVVRRAIHKGAIHNFIIDILQDYSKKYYSYIKRNMKGTLINNKELQNVMGKSKKVSVELLIEGVATEENFSVNLSINPHRISRLCRHCDACDYSISEDAFDVAKLVKYPTSSYHFAKEMDMFCFALMSEEFQARMHIAISPTCKTDEYLFKITNALEDLIRTFYDACHSHTRGR